MSRIGKLPITIPKDVEVNYINSKITVKGKFGTLETKIPDKIEIQHENNMIKVSLKNEIRSIKNGLKTPNIISYHTQKINF